MFSTLPNEIMEKIFFPLDYLTLCRTRFIQNTYIQNATAHDTFYACVIANNYTSMNWALQYKHLELSFEMYYIAIEAHSLSGMRYLHNAKCPTSPYVQLCGYAAEFGDLDILQHLVQCGYQLDTHTLARTIQYKHYNNIPWLLNNGCVFTSECMQRAAENNQLEIMQLCYVNGCDIDKYVLAHAAQHDDTHILEWLHSLNCEMDTNAISNALYKESYAALHWLLEHNCECGLTMLQIAISTKLDCFVELLLQYNCPMTAITFYTAVYTQNIHVCKLLLAANCPYDKNIFDVNCLPVEMENWVQNNLQQ